MKSILWLWMAAIVITLIAVIYQRQTGPTYPKKVVLNLGEKEIPLKLIRSQDVDSILEIIIPGISFEWNVNLFYRKYPVNEEWTMMPFMINEKGDMVAQLPSNQPKAGKLEYYIEFTNPLTDQTIKIPDEEPVIIRFKGSVPAWALLPHVIFMFIAMLFSNLTGILALFRHKKFKLFSTFTLVLLLFGGLIFGPVVQKYAFGEFWTGFPFGSDLTDNKTMIAFLFWLVAVVVNYKKERPIATILAAIVTLIVFSIPHSLRGSEFNHETGQILTGFFYRFYGLLSL